MSAPSLPSKHTNQSIRLPVHSSIRVSLSTSHTDTQTHTNTQTHTHLAVDVEDASVALSVETHGFYLCVPNSRCTNVLCSIRGQEPRDQAEERSVAAVLRRGDEEAHRA